MELTDRRQALKFLAGATAGLCPTCFATASALALEAKPAAGHATSPAAHGAPPHWNYEGTEAGPEHWGELSPANRVCGMGFQQSPVDLAEELDVSLGGISIDYQSMPLQVVNNGHTIQVNCEPGSSIRLDGRQFKLLQYHFHYPSEHAMGGKRFDLELHFVHVGDDGTLAVLGVFFRPGQDNATLEKVWNVMPQEKGQAKSGPSHAPFEFLPAAQAYYRYYGSLTTPPCSEKVIWSVFAQPIEAAPQQVQQFAKLFPMNARPLQPLNRRFILKSS